MPYTAAQLTQFFTTLSRGGQLDAATAAALNTAGQQNQAGLITDAQALAVIYNSAQVRATTDVAVASYAFFTGGTPSSSGIDYLLNNPGTGFNTSYYNGTGGTAANPNPTNGFNTANRYYNAAMNLAGSPGTVGYASFIAQYGALSIPQAIATLYNQIIGNASVGAAAAANAVTAITAAVPYFQQLAQARVAPGGNVDAATKAIIASYILQEGIKADVGIYSRALDQFNTAFVMGNAVTNTNLLATYGAGGANFNPASGALGDNQTFNAPATANATIVSAGVAANGVATLGVGATPTLIFTGDLAVNNGQLQINQAGAATNANDLITIRFTAQNVSTPVSLITPGVETISVSAELGGAPGTGTVLSLDIQDPALTTLIIGGNEPVAYSAPSYALLDGTVSGGALRNISALNAGAPANIDVSNVGAANAVVTIVGSNGGDTISFRSFATVNGGGGVDTFVAYAPTTAAQAAAPTLADSVAGETLAFFGLRVTAFNATAIATPANFQQGLDAAAAGAAGRASYFLFGGDTYVVADASAAATFQPGADYVVKLAGVHVLTPSMISAQGALILGG